jgi:hypothetical protein
MLFDFEYDLSKIFPALSPFSIRREKAGEVFLLIRRINAKSFREKGYQKNDIVTRDDRGNVHIRREAKNDNWW